MDLKLKLIRFFLHLFVQRKRKKFIEACKNPLQEQEKVKKKILSQSKLPFPETPTDYSFYCDKKEISKEKVRFYEVTSGSTGVKKEIPYNDSLLKSFQNMFLLWVHDLLFHSGIPLQRGKFFMSVSPKIGTKNTDDRKYLSPFLNFLLSPFLASHPDHHEAKNGEEFLFKIAGDLVQSKDLEIISIWSPTYLLSLLDFIKKHQRELGLDHCHWNKLWPHLKLISCWTSAQAKIPAEKLKRLFPNVMIQGKGLLMTEAPITIPWSEANGFVPLINETLLEFWDGEKILGPTEIEKDKSYTLIISQYNGFLRYNTFDEVKVTGYYHQTPLLEFIGRTQKSSDLAGEKLSEFALQEIFKDHLEATFFIIPDQREELPRYTILSDQELPFDEILRPIYHYNLARELNQLKGPLVKITKSPLKAHQKFCQDKGISLGDIKEKILFSDLEESRQFLEWIDKELPSSHLSPKL